MNIENNLAKIKKYNTHPHDLVEIVVSPLDESDWDHIYDWVYPRLLRLYDHNGVADESELTSIVNEQGDTCLMANVDIAAELTLTMLFIMRGQFEASVTMEDIDTKDKFEALMCALQELVHTTAATARVQSEDANVFFSISDS